MSRERPVTPDGRYFVSRGRLWRRTDPRLPGGERRAAIKSLMQARHAVRGAKDAAAVAEARARIEVAKHALGESGPVWWDDGAPDESGLPPWESRYAGWWDALPEPERRRGLDRSPE